LLYSKYFIKWLKNQKESMKVIKFYHSPDQVTRSYAKSKENN